MAKVRKPQTLVLYVELEDNCGAVLAKRKVEVPVTIDKELDEAAVRQIFDEFVKTALPTKLTL
jgi:hypothetical protein